MFKEALYITVWNQAAEYMPQLMLGLVIGLLATIFITVIVPRLESYIHKSYLRLSEHLSLPRKVARSFGKVYRLNIFVRLVTGAVFPFAGLIGCLGIYSGHQALLLSGVETLTLKNPSLIGVITLILIIPVIYLVLINIKANFDRYKNIGLLVSTVHIVAIILTLISGYALGPLAVIGLFIDQMYFLKFKAAFIPLGYKMDAQIEAIELKKEDDMLIEEEREMILEGIDRRPDLYHGITKSDIKKMSPDDFKIWQSKWETEQYNRSRSKT